MSSLLVSPWRAAYDQFIAEDDDGADFHVLNHPGSDGRPLLIWVHPGDAVEDEEGFDHGSFGADNSDDDDENEDLYQNSLDFQSRMAAEIEQKQATHQVVIVHRQSSAWAFDQEMAQYNYGQAMLGVQQLPSTVHLFGDDLEAASAWIIKNLNTCDCPAIFMTGAYNDSQHGCVAAVGQAIEAAGTAHLTVSCWSPSEAGSCADGWQPALTAIQSLPETDFSPRRRPRP